MATSSISGKNGATSGLTGKNQATSGLSVKNSATSGLSITHVIVSDVIAGTGSFVLTGQDVLLPVSLTMTAEQGAFTLTGRDATLAIARQLTAEQGAFSLSGQAVALPVTHKLTAEQGSFSLSGQDVGLTIAGSDLIAEFGTFTLSGQPVVFPVTRLMEAEQGSFTLSGQALGFPLTRYLEAAQGSYTLSGQSVDFPITRILTAEQGSLTLSGQAVDFPITRSLTAEQGSFTLTGQDVALTVSGGGGTVAKDDVSVNEMDSAPQSSRSTTVTIGSGTKRKVFGPISLDDAGGGVFNNPSVTFDPGGADEVSGVQITGAAVANAVNDLHTDAFYMDIPDGVAAGEYTVQVTNGEAVDHLGIGAFALSGAATGQPEAVETDAAAGGSTSFSTTITTLTDGAMVCDHVIWARQVATGGVSPDDGQNKEYEDFTTQTTICGSTLSVATASTVDTGWSWNDGTRYTQMVISVAPA